MVLPAAVVSTLAGAWSLINITKIQNATEVIDPKGVGAHPVGLLLYHPAGYMSANIASTDPDQRPSGLTYPAQANQTDAALAMVGKHTLAYAGPLSASEESNEVWGEVTHGPLTVADLPSWVGSPQRRNYTVHEGGRVLRINATQSDGGIGFLYWRRLEG